MLRSVFCVMILAIAAARASYAGVIEVRHMELEVAEDGYLLNADFGLELNARLEEALHNGVALYFVVEFELTRARLLWFDEISARERLQVRLAYQPLLRTFRLSTGTLSQSFPSLGEALRALGQVRGWAVFERARVRPELSYTASVRMRLDTELLPRPFQVSALTSREWSLASDWMRLPFNPVAEGERGAKIDPEPSAK